MKSSDAALRSALYDSSVMAAYDLVTVTLAYGVQRWTTADTDKSFGGSTYYATGPAISHASIRSTYGTEVSTGDLYLRGNVLIGGTSIAQRALQGEFDDAPVQYRRAYVPNWTTTPTAVVNVFTGRVEEVMVDSFGVELRLKSLLAKAQEERPLRVVGPFCPWVLYGSQCGAVKATFTHARTVAAGTTASAVKLSSDSTMATPGGTLEFTSGVLNGKLASVRSYDSGTYVATLVSPLPQVPATGDGVNVVRGCDRRRTTCSTTFARLVSFGGFPDLPRGSR
jgi:uncharacterized phage protein (TIGR02218 family)